MYQLISHDTTYKGYTSLYSNSMSTKLEQIDKNELLDNLFSDLISQKQLKQYSIFSLLIVDFSSVRPFFEFKMETSFLKKTDDEKTASAYISDEEVLMEMIENDFIVEMPPKKRYSIKLEVKDIRKGEPKTDVEDESRI